MIAGNCQIIEIVSTLIIIKVYINITSTAIYVVFQK